MLKARLFFENARDKGDKYVLIVQKRQKDADSLTFAVSGSSGQVEMTRMEFTSNGPYSGGKNWGYAFVAKMNTEEPWEEHESLLRSLDFHW